MKTIEEVVKSLETVLGRSKRSGKEVRFNCHYCRDYDGYIDRKYHLHVNFDKRIVHCFRCGKGMTLVMLLRESRLNDTAREFIIGRASPQAPDSIFKSHLGFALPADLIYANRGYHGDVWEAYQYEIRYAVKRGMNATNRHFFGFTFNHVVVFNSKANISHYWERSIDEKRFHVPTTDKPLYFLNEALQYPVMVLAEGPFDALAWNAGSLRHGVALIGKSIADYQLEQLTLAFKDGNGPVQEIVIALDAGEFKSTVALCRRLADLRCKTHIKLSYIRLPSPDYDADELPYSQREELFKQRKQVSLKTLMGYVIR